MVWSVTLLSRPKQCHIINVKEQTRLVKEEILANFHRLVDLLPHDSMQARPMSSCSVCVSVCLSVRLSLSYILSKRINICSIFLPSGSHTILVFPCQTA